MLLQRLWYDRPVRIQLLIAVAAVNLLAVLAAGAISIFNTRIATRAEIEGSLEIAQRFVTATIEELAKDHHLNELSQRLPLQLKHLRHVRILLMDESGELSVLSPSDAETKARVGKEAPQWFATLVRPKLVGSAMRVVAPQGADPILIVGEPADEIAEAWHDFSDLALIWLALNGVIILVLHIVMGRVLDPLATLSRGMHNLEGGHYATRLARPKVKELAVITHRFNTLAEALSTARDENSRLYRQLISVQDEERREIANELHDEAGPCLFGITANASSIKTLADQLPDTRTKEISRRIGEILSIAERLKMMNRALLKKLRPEPLGGVEIADLLSELIVGFHRRHPDVKVAQSLRLAAPTYGERIDLTLYRSIQEALTNAIRHGNAGQLSVDLIEKRLPKRRGVAKPQAKLLLVIRDDGQGMSPDTPKGYGLSAMSERVRALGGSCAIESEPSKGTAVRIEIPVGQDAASVGRPDLAEALV